MAISDLFTPPTTMVASGETTSYKSPINELLATNDLAYSNIFYVKFLFDEITGTKLVGEGATATEVKDYRNMYSHVTTGTEDLFANKKSPIENTRPEDAVIFKNIKENIFTRIEGFSLPQQLNDTHTIPYFNREFLKVSTTYKQPKIINLTFNLDDYMILLYRLGNIAEKSGLSLDDINNSHGQAAFNNPNFYLELILYTGMLYNNDFDENNGVSYHFTNAKMLGFDGGLKFTRDTAQKMNISVSFKYQDMYKEFAKQPS